MVKGGTSLSKAFGLITRFSEDIDITVFRDDLGQATDVAELDALSGKKRRARLDAIRSACQAYIAGPLTEQFARLAATVIPEARFRVELDPEDKDGQTLLFWYPAVTATSGDYIRSAVKIESGAKSALDPHVAATLTPYVAPDLPDQDLSVAGATTVKPERTFWDKVMILLCAGTVVAAARFWNTRPAGHPVRKTPRPARSAPAARRGRESRPSRGRSSVLAGQMC